MAVASLADLLRKMRSPSQLQPWVKAGQIGSGTHWNSEWIQAGDPVAATTPTTTAATCDRTTTGALGQANKAGSEQRAWLRRYGDGASAGNLQGCWMLVDRLAHVGGLSGTVTTAQTVSTPTLTRSTSGVDVWAAFEVYTAIGATGTTATISYTNTTPTAGQTSPAIVVGGAGFQNARTFLPFGYAGADLGVTAVASVTVLATTGTAGNFGITLFRTLARWPLNNSTPYALSGRPTDQMCPMPAIPDNACLQLLHFGTGQTTSNMIGQLCFFED